MHLSIKSKRPLASRQLDVLAHLINGEINVSFDEASYVSTHEAAHYDMAKYKLMA